MAQVRAPTRLVPLSLVWWLSVLFVSAASVLLLVCAGMGFSCPPLYTCHHVGLLNGAVFSVCVAPTAVFYSQDWKTMTSWFPQNNPSCIIAEKDPFATERFLSSVPCHFLCQKHSCLRC